MKISVKDVEYVVLDVVELVTLTGTIAYRVFYVYDNNICYVTLKLIYFMRLSQEEIMRFAIHNHHSERKLVTESELNYTSLKTKWRKHKIECLLND
jgi:hypothetical protein